MNNIEDLIQRGYFQQYRQDKSFGKRQAESGSGQARGEREQTPKKKKENFVIFQKFEIFDDEPEEIKKWRGLAIF